MHDNAFGTHDTNVEKDLDLAKNISKITGESLLKNAKSC
jgi:hypothetical protein